MDTCKEAIDWMISRPESIKALMLKFPPACVVRLKDDTPLCGEHRFAIGEDWRVFTYLEDGRIGIGKDDGDFIHVRHEHIFEPVSFYNGQDFKWVANILKLGGVS